jgi:hypothetical protein
MCTLPTRRSSAFMCICDIVPDEDEASLSMPQEFYISTITGWTDTKLEPRVHQMSRELYKKALPVSCGTYIADYDPICEDANVSLPSRNREWIHALSRPCKLTKVLGQAHVRHCTCQIPQHPGEVGPKRPVSELQEADRNARQD